MADHDRRVRILAKGRVQAVGFRAAARTKGEELGLAVSPENQDDGSVVIEAEGPDDKVQELISWAQDGPRFAKVDDLSVEELPSSGKRSRGFA